MSRVGELQFGAGSVEALAGLLASRNWRQITLIVSRSAYFGADFRNGFEKSLRDAGVGWRVYRYDRMPGDQENLETAEAEYSEATPAVVDAIRERESGFESRGEHSSVIVAIGGGSAVDTGKALSAALRHEGSIRDYLEGVGTREPTGAKVPFVAVPTTAGTGSEATKNAVLSEPGDPGYKKSLRHEAFVPDLAVVDPLLQTGCPAGVTAASGLDAICQLLEAYLSTEASPLTDALALDGLAAAGRSFARAVERGESDVDARAGMAYAAYLSGRCLANAGLGVVHGLAGPAGAHSAVPHGVFCGLLLPRAIEMLVERLVRSRDGVASLAKLATAGRVLAARGAGSMEANIQLLLDRLVEFRKVAELPGLRSYDFTGETVQLVAAEGNSKASPVKLDEAERAQLLESSL